MILVLRVVLWSIDGGFNDLNSSRLFCWVMLHRVDALFGVRPFLGAFWRLILGCFSFCILLYVWAFNLFISLFVSWHFLCQFDYMLYL